MYATEQQHSAEGCQTACDWVSGQLAKNTHFRVVRQANFFECISAMSLAHSNSELEGQLQVATAFHQTPSHCDWRRSHTEINHRSFSPLAQSPRSIFKHCFLPHSRPQNFCGSCHSWPEFRVQVLRIGLLAPHQYFTTFDATLKIAADVH